MAPPAAAAGRAMQDRAEGSTIRKETELEHDTAGTTPTMVASGIIRKIVKLKGFGFVTPDNGVEDVFLHVGENPILLRCQGGESVLYNMQYDDRRGKWKGVNLTLMGAVDDALRTMVAVRPGVFNVMWRYFSEHSGMWHALPTGYSEAIEREYRKDPLGWAIIKLGPMLRCHVVSFALMKLTNSKTRQSWDIWRLPGPGGPIGTCPGTPVSVSSSYGCWTWRPPLGHAHDMWALAGLTVRACVSGICSGFDEPQPVCCCDDNSGGTGRGGGVSAQGPSIDLGTHHPRCRCRECRASRAARRQLHFPIVRPNESTSPSWSGKSDKGWLSSPESNP